MYIPSLHMHLHPYSYTFTRSFDSLDLHIQIYLLLIRYLRGSHASWGAEVLLLDILFRYSLTLLHFYCFHDSVQWTHSCSISFIHLLSCVGIYCTVVVLSYHHNDYITCWGYLGLAYMCGVFSSRIYIAILCRDSVFPIFWEVRLDNAP